MLFFISKSFVFSSLLLSMLSCTTHKVEPNSSNKKNETDIQSSVDYSLQMAMANAQEGRSAQAIERYLFVIQNRPTDLNTRLLLANEYKKSGLIHLAVFELNEILKMVPEKVAQWRNSQSYNFDAEIGLAMNKSSSAKATLVEFADFKCPHCKVASQTLDRFTTNNPQVHFIYKPFPLDGTCNTSSQIPKGDGSRCTLAAWTLCSEKLFKKGWGAPSLVI